jgi:apolipoprotein N-acyltransferase
MYSSVPPPGPPFANSLIRTSDPPRAATSATGDDTVIAGVITGGPEPDTWQNTVAVFTDDPTAPRDTYAKRQPVPFGEYIPFRSLIGWYPPIQRMRPTDAVGGTETGVLDAAMDGVRVGAVICFESVFPRLVHSQVREGAKRWSIGPHSPDCRPAAGSDDGSREFTSMLAPAGHGIVLEPPA